MIQFEKETCTHLETALTREWLETNGLGGFASSTIIGLNTRRYHGLLTAATQPPVGRMALLSKLEETIILKDGRRFELSANQYPGVVHPQGYQYLKQFRIDPFPRFTYDVEGIEIEKSVFMVHGENTTIIQYELKSALPEGLQLEIHPLIAYRDYHSTMHENNSLNSHILFEEGLTAIHPYEGVPTLFVAHNAIDVEPTGYWFRHFQYPIEQERGLDYSEDLYDPFLLRFDLNQGSEATIIASTERRSAGRAGEYRQAEIERRQAVLAKAPSEDEFIRALVAAADQFIVAREDSKTVIAGYHWFTDWGRDTMIALPGLTLVTGRADIAQSILLAFARNVDQGMLPNRFPDAGEQPEYNTIDATLWFFEAVRSLVNYTHDLKWVRANLYGVLTDIIDWHVRGTRYNIRMDDDGLIGFSDPTVQLTWMDVKIGDYVVTPRCGKPVEIQALWYNALRVMQHLAHEFREVEAELNYERMAERTKKSFNQTFWNESAGCLFDVVQADHRDATIRPNQILAVSLPHVMLPQVKAKKVVEAVERELLTPYGLRSLSPNDPQYRGRYEGDSYQRDTAYHEGTVWAWLMGPFLTAYVKVNRGTKKSRAQGIEWLAGFRQHLNEAGLGQVSEIFDGDAPHHPRGCMAQAWSVAELLRVMVEDLSLPEPAKTSKPKRSGKRAKASGRSNRATA